MFYTSAIARSDCASLGGGRERGIYAAFQPVAVPDPSNFLEHPAVAEVVRSTLSSGTEHYDVIMGNHGTGKSTIVEKITKETAGAIYVFINPFGDIDQTLTSAFMDALI